MNRAAEMLLETLIYSGVIWAALMAAKRLFREKLSPRAHLALWLILIARLVVPVSFDAGIHLVALPAAESEEVQAAPQEAEMPLLLSVPEGRQQPKAAPRAGEVSGGETAAALQSAPQGAVSWSAGPEETAVCVWILGMLLTGAVTLRGYEKLRRDVRSRMVQGADPLHLLFQECLQEMGIRRRVVLAVQNELAGPALMFPNVVLMPENMRGRDAADVKMALRHELTHLMRRDHLRAAGLSLLRTVWWFDPFVWLAVREIREDIETACDSDVVTRLGSGSRAAYARTVLSMFGQTETNQAVLGMAFGGARKNAERRIRGIFMHVKSRSAGKAAVLLLTGVLGVACFTTACQPTPAQEAVVNQKEGIPEEALRGSAGTVSPDATTAPAAAYSAAEHWSETIDKADNFKVIADTDILTPDVEAYPVERIEPRELTQEVADQLIDYFAPGAAFYSTTQQLTKAEWEERIVEMRETLAMDQEAGDEDAATADQITIDEWTRLYEQAPETVERQAADTAYTYMTDYETGEEIRGPGANYIAISAEGPDGSVMQFDVSRRNDDDESQWAQFAFVNAVYQTEAEDRENQESLRGSRAGIEHLSEPARSEELDDLAAMESEVERRMAAYTANSMDLGEAAKRAEKILSDLGIRNLGIVSCEKALWGPYSGQFSSEFLDGSSSGLTRPGVYVEFRRENGGIPCLQPEAQFFGPRLDGESYSAPFVPEYGSMLLDEQGQVRLFTWNSPSQVAEIVAPDCELIPLSEAKERLVDELYRAEVGLSAEYPENAAIEYTIDEMQLVMGFANAKDDPDDALVIPAWYIEAQAVGTQDGESEPVSYNQQTFMISALDGSPILMANSF